MQKYVSIIQYFMPMFLFLGAMTSISTTFSAIYVRQNFNYYNLVNHFSRILKAQPFLVIYVLVL